jgi:hypothetical protein
MGICQITHFAASAEGKPELVYDGTGMGSPHRTSISPEINVVCVSYGRDRKCCYILDTE